MIRQPTSREDMYRIHTEAMRVTLIESGRRHVGDGYALGVARHRLRQELGPSKLLSLPHCGWWKYRFIKGGPWVPAMILLIQFVEDGQLVADEEEVIAIGMDPARTFTGFPERARAPRPISEEDYVALLHQHDTDPVMRATHAPVDITRTGVIR